jgi:DNA polymerase
VPIEKITAAQRFIGKVAVLALGFGGGKRAFAKMAKNFGVDIPEDRAEEIKRDWREANNFVVDLWKEVEDAAKAAIQNPGKAYSVAGNKVAFKVRDKWLLMRLPSGRKLAYLNPDMDGDQIVYEGIDTYTRRWTSVSTWGGKLVENAIQAIARDLLVHGMFNLTAAGYDIVLTVHDEIVNEVEQGFGSLEEASALMCSLPTWATGLPVSAEGWRGQRYRK